MIIMGLFKPEKQEESGLKFTEYTKQLSHKLVEAETPKAKTSPHFSSFF